MPLRRAKYSDLRRVVDIVSKAFYDDPLNDYFYPNRREHPEDYLRDCTHDLMISWWKYDRVWIVSYDGTEVNGVVCWARRGKGSEQLWNIPWWDPSKHEDPCALQTLTLSVPYLARAAITKHERQRRSYDNLAYRLPSAEDPEPVRKYNFGATMGPFAAQHFSEPELSSEHWEVCTLAVHPDYQKRGIGAELVRWGTERAKVEKVPCIVISSTGSENFYQSQGFSIYVGCAGTVDRVVDGKTIENPMKHRVTSGGHIYKTSL